MTTSSPSANRAHLKAWLGLTNISPTSMAPDKYNRTILFEDQSVCCLKRSILCPLGFTSDKPWSAPSSLEEITSRSSWTPLSLWTLVSVKENSNTLFVLTEPEEACFWHLELGGDGEGSVVLGLPNRRIASPALWMRSIIAGWVLVPSLRFDRLLMMYPSIILSPWAWCRQLWSSSSSLENSWPWWSVLKRCRAVCSSTLAQRNSPGSHTAHPCVCVACLFQVNGLLHGLVVEQTIARIVQCCSQCHRVDISTNDKIHCRHCV